MPNSFLQAYLEGKRAQQQERQFRAAQAQEAAQSARSADLYRTQLDQQADQMRFNQAMRLQELAEQVRQREEAERLRRQNLAFQVLQGVGEGTLEVTPTPMLPVVPGGLPGQVGQGVSQIRPPAGMPAPPPASFGIDLEGLGRVQATSPDTRFQRLLGQQKQQAEQQARLGIQAKLDSAQEVLKSLEAMAEVPQLSPEARQGIALKLLADINPVAPKPTALPSNAWEMFATVFGDEGQAAMREAAAGSPRALQKVLAMVNTVARLQYALPQAPGTTITTTAHEAERARINFTRSMLAGAFASLGVPNNMGELNQLGNTITSILARLYPDQYDAKAAADFLKEQRQLWNTGPLGMPRSMPQGLPTTERIQQILQGVGTALGQPPSPTK